MRVGCSKLNISQPKKKKKIIDYVLYKLHLIIELPRKLRSIYQPFVAKILGKNAKD